MGWHPPSSHSRTKSRNPIWTCFCIAQRVVRHVQVYMCVHDTPVAHTQTRVCPCPHMCAFSPLQRLLDLGSRSPGPDSARVRAGKSGQEEPRQSPPFPTSSVKTLLHHTQNRRSPASRSGSMTGDKAQLRDDCPEDRSSLSPRVRAGPNSCQEESGVTPAPHSPLPQESSTEMAPRDRSPGSKAAPRPRCRSV